MTDITPTTDNAALSERGYGGRALQGHIIITPDAPDTAKWYVVHTQSGHEVRIAETLKQRVYTLNQADKVFEVLIPTQDKIVIKHGKKSTIKEKIFPGYMLVKMIVDDASWLVVRTTAGVTGFVGVGNKPTPLSNIEVMLSNSFRQSVLPNLRPNLPQAKRSRLPMDRLPISWAVSNLSMRPQQNSRFWSLSLAGKHL